MTDSRQAYATDLVKDGTVAFAFKISGHKHTFEAQTAPERDGWFVAVEKAIAEAKEAKEGIESSEGYKEQKEKIGKSLQFGSHRLIKQWTIWLLCYSRLTSRRQAHHASGRYFLGP
jgi:hypothetical protein